MDVYNQFAKFFIQLSFLFVNTSIIFPEMQHALRLAIIYHAVGQNTRTKIQKDVFLSKMPFDECSAAMGFQVKEIKRQSRAVKVTHPPAERRQLHKRSDSGLSQSNAD